MTQTTMHQTLFTKELDDGGEEYFGAILGAFWCNGTEAIQTEDDGHECVRASATKGGGA